MLGGIFSFVFAIVTFAVVLVVANPMLAALGTGVVLPGWGVFVAGLCAAGLVVKK